MTPVLTPTEICSFFLQLNSRKCDESAQDRQGVRIILAPAILKNNVMLCKRRF